MLCNIILCNGLNKPSESNCLANSQHSRVVSRTCLGLLCSCGRFRIHKCFSFQLALLQYFVCHDALCNHHHRKFFWFLSGSTSFWSSPLEEKCTRCFRNSRTDASTRRARPSTSDSWPMPSTTVTQKRFVSSKLLGFSAHCAETERPQVAEGSVIVTIQF